MRVETESKYYCIEPEKLIDQCEKLGLKRVKYITEDDEYFTDLDSAFIRNRTCLRIRNTDNKDMEITFKGKSLELLGQYSKIENNIKALSSEYNNYVALFSSLGYYSYVNVNKERIIYNYPDKKYEFNLMIDKLNGIGGFVEFEIIANGDDYHRDELIKELNGFVRKFIEFNLIEATEPYRDIVAKNIYKNNVLSKNKDMYIDIDNVVIDLEKDFYKKYKNKIESILGHKLKWGMFKSLNDEKLVELINDYFTNKMFDTTELLAIFKLLNDINYHKYYITKANRLFFIGLLKKINISIDVDNDLLDSSKISKGILKNSVVLSNSLKEIIQTILIIINMESE